MNGSELLQRPDGSPTGCVLVDSSEPGVPQRIPILYVKGVPSVWVDGAWLSIEGYAQSDGRYPEAISVELAPTIVKAEPGIEVHGATRGAKVYDPHVLDVHAWLLNERGGLIDPIIADGLCGLIPLSDFQLRPAKYRFA